jgi:hypothetical protein
MLHILQRDGIGQEAQFGGDRANDLETQLLQLESDAEPSSV